MDKILVTGGTGLVGRCFTGPRYERIGSKHGNLLDRDFLSRLISHSDYEGIIHCAARVGGIVGNMNNQGLYFYENIMMNSTLIEEARIRGIKKLVFFSSTCVFPDKVEYPLTPEKIHLGPPHPSNYGYAYAKRMGIIQAKAYREQYGVNYISVIPCNIYGPGDNYNITDGHVIPSLIHKIYKAKLEGSDFTVWGSGKPMREFIYSQDVADLTSQIYDNYQGEDPVILSTSEEVSIKDLVYMIAKIFEFKGRIVFDDSKPDGQFRKPSDNSVIKSMFPDFKFTPLEQGLEMSIDWFLKNYNTARK